MVHPLGSPGCNCALEIKPPDRRRRFLPNQSVHRRGVPLCSALHCTAAMCRAAPGDGGQCSAVQCRAVQWSPDALTGNLKIPAAASRLQYRANCGGEAARGGVKLGHGAERGRGRICDLYKLYLSVLNIVFVSSINCICEFG
jgi:hypothetical protein